MLPGPLQRLLVISPHCDDAVFSCGALLAAHPGSVVVTIFAAGPPCHDHLTEWDRAAGFEPGDDVMAHRRAEDAKALGLLSAYPLWLDFCDSQYRRSPSIARITSALDGVMQLVRPHSIVAPWGLFHSDHTLASEACIGLRFKYPSRGWFLYEDAIYRRIPGLLADRIALMRACGVHARRVAVAADRDCARKPEAVHCYRSQLRALTSRGRPGYLDAFEPERFWVIESPPAARRSPT
ncbi:MAG: PIG-L family deacetylase [Nitrospira sp.]